MEFLFSDKLGFATFKSDFFVLYQGHEINVTVKHIACFVDRNNYKKEKKYLNKSFKNSLNYTKLNECLFDFHSFFFFIFVYLVLGHFGDAEFCRLCPKPGQDSPAHVTV